MPSRSDPLRAQIKALEAHLKEQKAERKAAEAPLRKQRSELLYRVRKFRLILTKAEARFREKTQPYWLSTTPDEATRRRILGRTYTEAEAMVKERAALLASAELDLDLFTELHPELT
jgi:hypothetical protein